MRKRRIPAKNTRTDVINIRDVYEDFAREKRRYDPPLFCVDKEIKRKRKETVPKAVFIKIILEYLKVYFFEFYTKTEPMYFPLGGFMKKVVYPTWVKYMRKGKTPKRLSGGDRAIGLFWFLRPSPKMYFLVRIKKLTGSSNRIPELEKKFTAKYSKDFLPIFNQEIKKGIEHKTLYTCTLT